MFLKTFAPYIEEYKNVPYERLTEKDQSVALARIIKKLYCNGVLVTEFFSKEMAQWDGLEIMRGSITFLILSQGICSAVLIRILKATTVICKSEQDLLC